ncbi:MAG: putative signal peptide protein [Bacteroidota bacterium]|jgi:hypothetical protein
MKKIIYIVLFISALAFGQEGSTQVTVENYQHLKTHGLLNSTTPYQFVDLLTPNPKTHPLNPEKNALCNCLIQLDNTFSLAMAPNDDASSPYIQLPFTFNFYGTSYDSIVINNNGNISFSSAYVNFTANPFPDPTYNMIAPFWGDVDTRSANGGNVWYKTTPDALIVIWDHVGYFNMHDTLTNTFQLIISNGTDTLIHGNNNVSFCYGDMQWTTGDASGGVNGIGGTAATVGLNIGNGIDFFQIGQFDSTGTFFDGPYNQIDHVDFLDNQEMYFNVAAMNAANIPPLLMNSSICDTIDVYTGDTLHKSMNLAEFTLSMATPEPNQTLSYSLSCDAPSAFTYNETGNGIDYIQLACTFNANNLQPGTYHVNLNVSDNGNPSENTSISIPIRVHFDEMSSTLNLSDSFIEPYPNPTSDIVRFNAKEIDFDQVNILSLDGKILYQNSLNNESISLVNLTTGVYLIQFLSNERVIGTNRIQLIK